ncbi:DUF7262 family protein [Haloplanus halophilus]|uniref:DUF7262 family protein n=1 Tax=Haloplanus halophilus TaxID=2949993 RepID=UPI00203AEE9F|nr:hypothetical protein [Haloplanus sp. GDY1]
MPRAQLSLSVVEAAIGVVLVVGIAAGFTVGVADHPSAEPRLDALARDTATVLGSEPTPNGRDSRLVALARSPESFERARPDTRERIVDLLPADVAFRVHTPHGTLGYPRPPRATAESTTVPTRHGSVTVWVWYG